MIDPPAVLRRLAAEKDRCDLALRSARCKRVPCPQKQQLARQVGAGTVMLEAAALRQPNECQYRRNRGSGRIETFDLVSKVDGSRPWRGACNIEPQHRETVAKEDVFETVRPCDRCELPQRIEDETLIVASGRVRRGRND